MSPVAVPPDKRFRRARVKPGRPRRNWRRLAARTIRAVAIAGVVLFAIYRGRDLAAQAHVLQIQRIDVQGNEHLSTGEVLAVLGGMRGQNLIWCDLNGWRQRLLSSPWVRDADLRRSLPSTVEVVVSERRPIAHELAQELLERADKLMYEAKSERTSQIYPLSVRIEGGTLVDLAAGAPPA